MKITALEAWLKSVLDISDVFQEPGEIDESLTPAAYLGFEYCGSGDTLDPNMVTEVYTVGLLSPIRGATGGEKESELESLERKLVKAVNSLLRVNPAWHHIEAARQESDNGAGITIWRITLYVQD